MADTTDSAMNVLRDAINDWHGTHQMLAIRCGVSRFCIDRIVNGRTKWPRPLTFNVLCSVLGLELTLRRINNHREGDDE